MSEPRKSPTLLTVIVPTRNEAANIRPLLDRLAPTVADTAVELLFVDDSTDETPQVVTAVAADYPFPVRLLHRAEADRNGLSGAVVDGMKQASGTWMGVMDADLQHPPEMMMRMLAHARQTGADLVVGSRAADIKGPKGLSLGRTLTSQSLTILARTVFPRLLKNASDPLTGLFLVRRSAVDVAELRPDGFKILLEILVRCPNLHVSELFFDFAQRHAGESKADFREGLRFFRHLMRLRLTANIHVTRLAIAGLITLLVNNVLLLWLTRWLAERPLLGAILAMEVALLLLFALMDGWAFFRRTWQGRWRRLFDFALLNHAFLLIFWLPVLWWAAGRGRLSVLSANLLGLLLTAAMRYIFSEQWIWTRGLISRWREPFRYSIHGIVGIESAVHLPDLATFRTVEPLPHTDIRLLVDRHGTPSCVPGAICYDEGLGRFGFGLSIMPGETTEAIVSPLLEKSPYVLYKNVVEPLVRWVLVRHGYALVYGGCLAVGDEAVLITAAANIRKTATLLHTIRHNDCAFLSDDVTIVGRNGRVYSFPKLLSIRQHAVNAVDTARLSWLERPLLWLKRLVYDERVRAAGLALVRLGLPIATLNAYLQRWMPPAKLMLHRLLPNVTYRDAAQLTQLVRLVAGEEAERPLSTQAMLQLLIEDGRAGFGYPPYSFMVEALSHWRGEELATVEHDIIAAALRGTTARRIQSQSYDWWQKMDVVLDRTAALEFS